MPFRGEENNDAHVAPADDFFDDDGNAPRTMRPAHSPSRPSPPPSTPRRSPPPPEEPRVSIPEPSVLLESPLDAPPIVLFQAPKPPPSDETWAQLRTDLTPKRDVLMEEVHAERRSRSRGFPAYAENPQAVSREAVESLAKDPSYAEAFEGFQRDMVYGARVPLHECLPALRELATLL